jgi:hypothetical protein
MRRIYRDVFHELLKKLGSGVTAASAQQGAATPRKEVRFEGLRSGKYLFDGRLSLISVSA